MMRTMGLLQAWVMAWAVSIGVMTTVSAPDATAAVGDLAQCLIPMKGALPPLVPCADRPPSWSDPERQPDPQWMAGALGDATQGSAVLGHQRGVRRVYLAGHLGIETRW